MNIAIVVIAIAAVFAGTEWLATHPVVARYRDELRVILIAAILALPAAVLGRHLNLSAAVGDGIRISERQLPELFAELRRACEKLGLKEVPELYVGRLETGATATFSLWRKGSVVVLDADRLLDKEWQQGFDWVAFELARALGAIRLGHTAWWVELLTVYAKKVPGARTPLLLSWALSRDRCAAYVVPDGVRGLLIEAVGKDCIWNFDLGPVIAQEEPKGLWAWLATVRKKTPHLSTRLKELYRAGFFDLERDRRRRFTTPE